MLIFCLSFSFIHAEQQPIIKNTKREKAIEASIGNFMGATAAILVASFAKAYSDESLRVATQLPGWCSAHDLISSWINAGIVSYLAKGVAIIFAINGIFFAVEAYNANPLEEEILDNSFNNATEQPHE